MFSPAIQKLIGIFSKFPTVGPRTAGRFVFYLLKKPKEEIKELIYAISDLKNKIKFCRLCFLPFEGEEDLCQICKNKTRDRNILCVVEKESDLESIEKTGKYKGLYFILGATMSPLRRKEKKEIRETEFLKRIKDQEVKEIIIALNPTTEGESTSLYLERLAKKENKKTTRLGRGLPLGAELEYADEETLSSALEGRK